MEISIWKFPYLLNARAMLCDMQPASRVWREFPVCLERKPHTMDFGLETDWMFSPMPKYGNLWGLGFHWFTEPEFSNLTCVNQL
jgi:hypothetical protein